VNQRKKTKPSGKSKGGAKRPLVGIIMGSISDLETMKEAAKILEGFAIPHEVKVVSAHRTPELMVAYAKGARDRGIEVIIAGAGGAAHLPGMTASLTSLPVVGVPVTSKNLNGLDSLLSIAQMPAGIPVATMAIGNAKNAGLMAARILALKYPAIADAVDKHRASLEKEVRAMKIPEA
jgi:5-(carboxyamino)imidazole ribonucleotide mutase